MLKEKAGSAFAQYNKDQLTPVRIDSNESHALISEFNDLGEFRSKSRECMTHKSFREFKLSWYPHLKAGRVFPELSILLD